MRTILFILFSIPCYTFCQILAEATRVAYKSASCDEVILYAAQDCAHCYYYQPVDFRMSSKPDGTPEGSFVTWKNDNESKIIGGVLHLLTTWGLTAEREKATQAFLRSTVDSLGTLMGPSTIRATPESLTIHGDDKLAKILKRSLSNVPLAPLTPGSKTALSFRFNEDVIADVLDCLKNPGKTTASIKALYTYEVTSPNGIQKTRTTMLTLGFKEILQRVKNEK